MDWPMNSRKDGYCINEEGMNKLVFRSQQHKAKNFRKHFCNVTRIRTRTRQAITGRDNQMQTLEFTNEEERQEILSLNEEVTDLMANRHVTRCGCFDNVLCFMKKNSGEVHSYYVIRCQYRQLEKDKRWVRLRYPNMEVAGKCDVMMQMQFTDGIDLGVK